MTPTKRRWAFVAVDGVRSWEWHSSDLIASLIRFYVPRGHAVLVQARPGGPCARYEAVQE